jgi:uncharacterized membrane protein YhaH (DUF805 family)
MIDVKPYFVFEGKATRSEYWAINLISYFSLIVAGVVSAVIAMSGILGAVVGVAFMLVCCIAVAWLIIVVTVKRCRDIGISPLFTLSLLIPYIAFIPFIVFGCLKSEVKDDNAPH